MTRESRIKYLKAFGYNALEKAALAVMLKQGVENFITDEQLDAMCLHQATEARRAEQINLMNRRNMRIAS